MIMHTMILNHTMKTEPNAVVNEVTNTVHKHKTGASEFETDCGLTHHLTHNDLRQTSLAAATAKTTISKCGRCFPGTGGY